MEALINILKVNKLTLGSAESITGGLFASSIVSVSGASEVFLGGIVSYANSVKENVLNVSKEIIDTHGVVSEEVVIEMANSCQKLLGVDVAVSFSGNAGPEVLDQKPVGAIWTCLKVEDLSYTYYDILSGTRNEIREEIVNLSAKRIIDILNQKGEY